MIKSYNGMIIKYHNLPEQYIVLYSIKNWGVDIELHDINELGKRNENSLIWRGRLSDGLFSDCMEEVKDWTYLDGMPLETV